VPLEAISKVFLAGQKFAQYTTLEEGARANIKKADEGRLEEREIF
jgi:hypothetical protein